jgi:hypothetical protein
MNKPKQFIIKCYALPLGERIKLLLSRNKKHLITKLEIALKTNKLKYSKQNIDNEAPINIPFALRSLYFQRARLP